MPYASINGTPNNASIPSITGRGIAEELDRTKRSFGRLLEMESRERPSTI